MTKPTYEILSNRHEGALATTDDICHAGTIVNALMLARTDPDWLDYWVRDDNGKEFYWDEDAGTVFSAGCFAQAGSVSAPSN